MKNKILSTYLQGNYRQFIGEFSSASYGMFGTGRVNNNKAKSRYKNGTAYYSVILFLIFVLDFDIFLTI